MTLCSYTAVVYATTLQVFEKNRSSSKVCLYTSPPILKCFIITYFNFGFDSDIMLKDIIINILVLYPTMLDIL